MHLKEKGVQIRYAKGLFLAKCQVPTHLYLHFNLRLFLPGQPPPPLKRGRETRCAESSLGWV